MLEQLFGSKTRVKLLHIFFHSPERPFYVRELARLAESQLNAVRRELGNLQKVGIIMPVVVDAIEAVESAGTGRSKYYKLDPSCLLYTELKSLLFKAQILYERELIEVLKAKAGKIKMLLFTGCFTDAKNAETDILLVGEIRPMLVSKLVADFEKKLGKPLRYTIMSEKEFNDRREIGDKFLYSIFEGKHVSAVDELTQVA
ncbi:MAG: winged helix-turn-helix transcriptional regulator [Candidatus Magasanikbacteria bacterium]|nr:winged helix-turn-helix transcriptional regulator [Candidatus Magasanikbacteria bacterium]